MDLDTFLAQEDVHLLVQALNTFALEVDAADDRKHVLVNAGFRPAFLSTFSFGTSPYLFANMLVAHFREYRVSDQQPAYHPMVRLLDYLLRVHELEDQDRKLFQRLLKQCQENLDGLAARGAVGRIESPPGTARGTGVLVDEQLLLTCKHVFERIFDNGLDRVWVRFGYKAGKYGIESGEVFELDTESIDSPNTRSDSSLDYVLVKINGKPAYRAVLLSNDLPNTAQSIRLVHHPRGEPVQISVTGQIIQVDQEYMYHDIKADYGSSGAPIFDLNWRVVAIHRGKLGLSRSYAPGETEGIPISAIWNDIEPHLSMYASC
jgi:trypsin-like peptidase/effector-associated domain 8 (EAD8)-containing protein